MNASLTHDYPITLYKRLYWLGVFLLGILLIGGLFVQLTPRQTPVSHQLSHHPDVFMESVSALRLDAQGQIEHEFHAPRLQHYPDDNTTDIDTPEITLYTPNQPTWQIHAAHARAFIKDKRILFWDHVRAEQQASSKKPATTFFTREITLYPKRRYAETSAPIKAVQPGITIKSVGLRADMQKGTLQLLAQVQGLYEPRVAKP